MNHCSYFPARCADPEPSESEVLEGVSVGKGQAGVIPPSGGQTGLSVSAGYLKIEGVKTWYSHAQICN